MLSKVIILLKIKTKGIYNSLFVRKFGTLDTFLGEHPVKRSQGWVQERRKSRYI